METCPNCGSEIRPTARFCTSCGYRIPERLLGSPSEGSGWAVAITTAPPDLDEAFADPAPVPVSWSMATVADEAGPAPVEEPSAEPEDVVAWQATAPVETIPSVVAEETINDTTANKVNIALFHIERLQQLVPDITGWSEEQAGAVNKAIASLETSLKGREADSEPFEALRETVRTAVKKNRDIDVMVALTDRASEIEDLLNAHDAYSRAVREALTSIKPAAVNYVAEVKRKPARRSSSRTRAKTTTTPAPM